MEKLKNKNLKKLSQNVLHGKKSSSKNVLALKKNICPQKKFSQKKCFRKHHDRKIFCSRIISICTSISRGNLQNQKFHERSKGNLIF